MSRWKNNRPSVKKCNGGTRVAGRVAAAASARRSVILPSVNACLLCPSLRWTDQLQNNHLVSGGISLLFCPSPGSSRNVLVKRQSNCRVISLLQNVLSSQWCFSVQVQKERKIYQYIHIENTSRSFLTKHSLWNITIIKCWPFKILYK